MRRVIHTRGARALLLLAGLAMPCLAAAQPPAPGGPQAAAGAAVDTADTADTRQDVDITLFTGISIDSFAAKELRTYINKDDAGEVSEQLIAGFDFSYRLVKPAVGRRHPSVWLYGETVHGARSGETPCETDEQKKSDLCQVAALNPAANRNGALAIFRKARTLEAFFGLRVEFLRLRSDSEEAAAALYAKGQLGMLTVAGLGGDVVDMHHVGWGVVLTRGPFKHTYLEMGYGTNGLFKDNPRRWKIDGFLSMGPDEAKVRPYAQIVVDADFKDGSDNVQSFFGFDVDVRNIWK